MTVHRITIQSNPRILYFFAFLAVIITVTVLLILYIGAVPGLIAGGITLFLLYHIVKHLKSTLSHLIRTSDESITFQFSINDIRTVDWIDITHAGTYREAEANRYSLFIYREKDDTFMTIPPEFTDFKLLRELVEEHTSDKFIDIVLEKGETIESRLKTILQSEERDVSEE